MLGYNKNHITLALNYVLKNSNVRDELYLFPFIFSELRVRF